MTGLIAERIYPYVVALAASMVWFASGAFFPAETDILASTLSVSGVLVGFLATSKAILLSMNSPVLRQLRTSGYIHDLVSYIAQAIWVNLAFCALNVVGYFLASRGEIFGAIWVFAAVAGGLCFIRVTHILLKVFRYASSSKP